MTIVPGEQLVSGDTVIQLADGVIERDDETLRWRTTRASTTSTATRSAEAWLVPLHLAAFDAIWTILTRPNLKRDSPALGGV